MVVRLSGQNSVLAVSFVLFYSVDLIVLSKTAPPYLHVHPSHLCYLFFTLSEIECSSHSPLQP